MKSKILVAILVFTPFFVSYSKADIFDIFLLAGQSNGGNFGELNSYDPQGYQGLNRDDAVRSEQGFNLDFARIYDRPSNSANTGLNEVFHSFQESQLDPGQFAVDRMAVNLNSMGNANVGIYSYNRNGRPLYNSDSDGGTSWYPGDDPANGDVYDDELYGYFKDWTADRIANLQNQGHTVNVRGIFWFQGEGDVVIGSAATDEYQANFQRLVDRFRVDFGSEVAIVATEIRETGNTAQQALQRQVNQSMANIAANDNLLTVVTTQDLEPLTSGNVHFTADAYYQLSDRWTNAYGQIAVPEPGSTGLFVLLMTMAVTRRQNRVLC